jgi:hypothetical protein
MAKVGDLTATPVGGSAFDIAEVANVLPARAARMCGLTLLPNPRSIIASCSKSKDWKDNR